MKNRLMNGSFRINQLGPMTLAPLPGTPDAYSFDGWRLNLDTASGGLPSARITTAEITNSPGSNYFGASFTRGLYAGKMLLFQPLELGDSVELAGQQLTFQFMASKSGVFSKLYAALMLWTGAADTLPATTIPAASWQPDGTNPRFATGWGLVSLASASNLSGGSATIIADALQCALTGSLQQFAFSVPNSTALGNLAVALWTDSMSDLDVLSLSSVALTPGSSVLPYLDPPYQEDLARCQRWLYVLPDGTYLGNAYTPNLTTINPLIFPVTMRGTPIIDNGSFSASSGNDGAFAADVATADAMQLYNSADNWTVGAAIYGSFRANAGL